MMDGLFRIAIWLGGTAVATYYYGWLAGVAAFLIIPFVLRKF